MKAEAPSYLMVNYSIREYIAIITTFVEILMERKIA